MTDCEQVTLVLVFDVSRMRGTPITLLRGLLKVALRVYRARCLRHELVELADDEGVATTGSWGEPEDVGYRVYRGYRLSLFRVVIHTPL